MVKFYNILGERIKTKSCNGALIDDGRNLQQNGGDFINMILKHCMRLKIDETQLKLSKSYFLRVY